MSFTRRTCGELLFTTRNRASEWLFSCVRSHVLLQSRLLIPTFATTLKRTHKRLLASMNASVNDEMSGAQETLSTTIPFADMRFPLFMVSSPVVHKIPLGRELLGTAVFQAFEEFPFLPRTAIFRIFFQLDWSEQTSIRQNFERHFVTKKRERESTNTVRRFSQD